MTLVIRNGRRRENQRVTKLGVSFDEFGDHFCYYLRSLKTWDYILFQFPWVKVPKYTYTLIHLFDMIYCNKVFLFMPVQAASLHGGFQSKIQIRIERQSQKLLFLQFSGMATLRSKVHKLWLNLIFGGQQLFLFQKKIPQILYIFSIFRYF